MINIKDFIDFSLYEAKTEAKENRVKDYLLFNGNKLEFIEKGKVTKTWTAVSGRTYYHWYKKPDVWNKRYTIPHTEWAKAKDEGPTPPGLYLYVFKLVGLVDHEGALYNNVILECTPPNAIAAV